MSHHNNPLNENCLEHIFSTFELLGQFNVLEANSRALMLKVIKTVFLHNKILLINK